MEYIVRAKKGPYDGPFSKNIITYFLENNKGETIKWHEGPNKSFNAEIGDIVTGIFVKDDNVIDYRNSNIQIIIKQLKLEL
jgi:hypothetical protein